MALDATITRRSLSNTSTPDVNQVYSALVTGDNVLILGSAGKQIQITGIVISTGTLGVYTLRTGDDALVVFNMSAHVPVLDHAVGQDSVLFSGTSGQNINMVVTGAAANAGIYLQYKLR